MAETWDLSLLIDTSTRIYDARGMTGQHLGLEARHLPDHHFIEFVEEANRAAFRRRLVKMVAHKLDIVRVRVLTASEGAQEFFAALRTSPAEGQWWLMLAAGLRDETPALAALERTGLADGDEFMMLVESAARQLKGEVDLMQVKAEILSEQSAGKTPPEVREKLASEFTEIVAENAYENIATQPQPGEYLLLKDRAKPAAEVMDQLSAAAQRLSIPPAELGLAARTMAMEELGGDFSQASINGVVYDLRHDPSKPIKQWELEPEAESWIKPVIRGAAAALGIKPSKTGRSRP
ncbi:MAG TPA: hypothetical protein VGF43_12585 [Dongiaceae bacterium]